MRCLVPTHHKALRLVGVMRLVMMLGRIARVSPMLTVELTRPDGSSFCVVDCGANVDVRAEKLVDFARMGTAYMKAACTDLAGEGHIVELAVQYSVTVGSEHT